jgi:uncharacterized protein YabE (DUF348 family)
MKRFFWFLLALVLISCQQSQPTVYILDGQNVFTFQPKSLTPAELVLQAGLTLSPADKIYYNGFELPTDYSLPPGGMYTLQIRRAVDVILVTPDGQTTFQSTAATIGQAVTQAGLQLYAADFLSPPAEAPLIVPAGGNAPLTVTYRPARDLTISVDGKSMTVKSSALTVGKALAEAGIPLLGLDKSLPAESEAVPTNPNNPGAGGQVKIVRVSESVSLLEKSIPYKTEYQMSDELELGAENLIKAGQTGLAISRVRVRLEDGVEVSRVTEAETVVRPPEKRVVGQGTKIAVDTLPGTGGLQYWRAVSMYATWYSPCHSGIDGCSYGTASGLPVKKGIAAMIPANFNALRGQQVYIPGYGVAVIADSGGGIPGKLWIDLAYTDDDNSPKITGWVTVYFLMPVPPNAAYVLQ